MEKRIVKITDTTKARDYNALAMWGRVKSATFRDRRKTLPRKAKHKGLEY